MATECRTAGRAHPCSEAGPPTAALGQLWLRIFLPGVNLSVFGRAVAAYVLGYYTRGLQKINVVTEMDGAVLCAWEEKAKGCNPRFGPVASAVGGDFTSLSCHWVQAGIRAIIPAANCSAEAG